MALYHARRTQSAYGDDPSLEPDDLAQEAVLAVWEKWPDPTGVALHVNALHLILRRRVADALRSRYGRHFQRSVPPASLDQAQGDRWPLLERLSLDPQDDHYLDQRAALSDAPLTGEQRDILRWSALGYPHKEIAQRLGVTVSRVSQRMNEITTLIRGADAT
jgi:RNA polymerase sigma factor (sigma-70 family)